MAAAAGPLQTHLRHRRAGPPAAPSPTTASCRSTYRKGRRSAWSAHPSLYKREIVPARRACRREASPAVGDPYAAFSYSMASPLNWGGQGADAGLYSNSEIHAIRILAMEPATDAGRAAGFFNHARERLRILGEIPRAQVSGEPTKGGGSRSTRTAIRTRAFWPRFPPTWPSPSRRSTRTAWC